MVETVSLGVFQGEAPQFIIFSASVAFYVYIHRFNWEYLLPKNRELNKPINNKLGMFDENERQATDQPFLEKNLKRVVRGLFFINLIILSRIILFHFLPVVGPFVFCSIDISILVGFLGILVYSLVVYRLLDIKVIETDIKFDNNKYQ